MLEAARIPLRCCFRERRLQKCNSGCVDGNEASLALHLGPGFREEGRRRRSLYMDGRYHDEILLGLPREDFDGGED